MAPSLRSRKRKEVSEVVESDDDLSGAELEGILSQSEDDESDVEDTGSEGEEPELDEDEDEDDEEADLRSDDEQAEKVNGETKTNGAEEEDDDKPNYRVVKDANGGVRYEYEEIDPVYDSDDTDAQGPVNTIGNIPLSFYDSDDGTLQIFHGKVVGDLMENATIVPVKQLRGHKVDKKLGVMDIDWHPKHPWIVSAGADMTCRLWA
ncbi:hypothetical protein M440DRAFT_1393601 [Trichoderma longibrachiatum ATCC 18648]|uniref:Uncharacterized protein n=1 Tax=Trichoderma longibrachiatum ATCC 18648 TaxID=983965 RepID=A0A2T4BWM4_TRILO|nr:hypothetical protein M440DRAFT_1393601 [Trichoderma longibrachiatum ATCC 18648]